MYDLASSAVTIVIASRKSYIMLAPSGWKKNVTITTDEWLDLWECFLDRIEIRGVWWQVLEANTFIMVSVLVITITIETYHTHQEVPERQGHDGFLHYPLRARWVGQEMANKGESAWIQLVSMNTAWYFRLSSTYHIIMKELKKTSTSHWSFDNSTSHHSIDWQQASPRQPMATNKNLLSLRPSTLFGTSSTPSRYAIILRSLVDKAELLWSIFSHTVDKGGTFFFTPFRGNLLDLFERVASTFEFPADCWKVYWDETTSVIPDPGLIAGHRDGP